MSNETKKQIAEIAPWINRVLLGIVAYFLIQTNTKFAEVIVKLDTVIITQATYARQLSHLEEKVNENKAEIENFEDNIAKFYENYGYLFSDRTKRKLE